MKSIGEFLRKTLETATNRIGSPFLSSTGFAWLVINYKFIVVLLSSSSFQDKFNYIDNVLFSDIATWRNHVFVYPLLSGIFYTVAYPFIDIFFGSLQEIFWNLREKAILFVQRKRPIDRDQTTEYFKKFDDKIKALDKALQIALSQRDEERSASLKKTVHLQEKVKRQTLLFLCAGTSLTPDLILAPLHQDYSSFCELEISAEVLRGFNEIKFKNEILASIGEIKILSVDRWGRRLVTRETIAEILLRFRAISSDDILDFFVQLGCLIEIDEMPKHYDASEGMEVLSRLEMLLNGTYATSTIKN